MTAYDVAAGLRLFHGVEDGGRWWCSRGREAIDSHDTRAEAFEHLARLAHDQAPSVVVMHAADGGIDQHSFG